MLYPSFMLILSIKNHRSLSGRPKHLSDCRYDQRSCARSGLLMESVHGFGFFWGFFVLFFLCFLHSECKKKSTCF